jgi:trimeric autotransporter adhesin
MNPLTQLKTITILPVLIALMLGCFGLSPQARAVCQEGCLTNNNTALGDDALLNNTGFYNTANGSNALLNNTTGFENTATGWLALSSNTTGTSNTATGSVALFNNITGGGNTATGYHALQVNNTGNNNTASGGYALLGNSVGSYNTATGTGALLGNTTGNSNTAIGNAALAGNTTGQNNIALGFAAGHSLTTGSDNIDIGNNGVADESNTIRIGTVGTQTTTYIAGIRETQLVRGTAVAVGVTPDGQLGVKVSSARFKEAIKPMDKASEAIFSLQPVTFRYKQDPVSMPQFGLVAEEVAKVNSDLVVPDAEGKPFTVRYDEINAMLLNEFLKEHKAFVEEQRKVTDQEATIKQLKSELEATATRQQKQIEALTAGLQKVSAELEASKSAPKIVNNP